MVLAQLVERFSVAKEVAGSNPVNHPYKNMATLNQVTRKPRHSKRKVYQSSALDNCPQSKGVCLRVFTRKPKKPNSSNRSVAKVKLSNGMIVDAAIPGEGHHLQEHGVVLVRGGRSKDLPGVKYKCVRGRFDLGSVSQRKNARSKYGTPRSS